MKYRSLVSIATSLLLLFTASACQKTEKTDATPSATVSTAKPALLEAGAAAPDIHATSQTGEAVSLAALRGKPVVVYFYPKDDTPGCTIEAEELRDLHGEIQQTGAVVIGVSTDDGASHQAFAEKYALPFLLLPDTDARIAGAFGVPLKNGRARRVTFVIGKDGVVKKVFPDVRPKGHGSEVLEALRAAAG